MSMLRVPPVREARPATRRYPGARYARQPVGGDFAGLRQVPLRCQVDLIVEDIDDGYGAVRVGRLSVLTGPVGPPRRPCP